MENHWKDKQPADIERDVKEMLDATGPTPIDAYVDSFPLTVGQAFDEWDATYQWRNDPAEIRSITDQCRDAFEAGWKAALDAK